MTDDFRDFINEKVLLYLPSNRIRRGDYWNFRCPICGDSKKNSRKKRGFFYLSTSSYHCFNCDANMGGLKFLQAVSGSDYEDIINEYKELRLKSLGRSIAKRPIQTTLDSSSLSGMAYLNSLQPCVKKEWKNPLTEHAREYLENRKVLEAPFLKEDIYSVFDKQQNEYILLPWRLNGIDAYYQLNDFEHNDSIGRKYIFPSKKEKLIYGLDNIDISFPYVICFEGVYDSLFIPNAIAIGGKTLTALQKKIVQERFPKHKIVMSFDNDRPGLEAMAKCIKSSKEDYYYFKWFDESTKEKDVNDFIVKHGKVDFFADKAKVESLIVNSISMKIFLIQKGVWVQ